jgi:hypothetical protein
MAMIMGYDEIGEVMHNVFRHFPFIRTSRALAVEVKSSYVRR